MSRMCNVKGASAGGSSSICFGTVVERLAEDVDAVVLVVEGPAKDDGKMDLYMEIIEKAPSLKSSIYRFKYRSVCCPADHADFAVAPVPPAVFCCC